MEMSLDITWVMILLSITGCVIGYFALKPQLYDPTGRVIFLSFQSLRHFLHHKQQESQHIRNLGYIRRRKPSTTMKLNPITQAEEAPLNPLLTNQSITKTREELRCIHGFIQSQLSYYRYSPSFSSSRMTGA